LADGSNLQTGPLNNAQKNAVQQDVSFLFLDILFHLRHNIFPSVTSSSR